MDALQTVCYVGLIVLIALPFLAVLTRVLTIPSNNIDR